MNTIKTDFFEVRVEDARGIKAVNVEIGPVLESGYYGTYFVSGLLAGDIARLIVLDLANVSVPCNGIVGEMTHDYPMPFVVDEGQSTELSVPVRRLRQSVSLHMWPANRKSSSNDGTNKQADPLFEWFIVLVFTEVPPSQEPK
jgi:hypothetical protein